MTATDSRQPPLSPKEGRLSDGRQVLRFRPTRWERTYQRLEITSGELLPGEQVPLLKNRREIRRKSTRRSLRRNWTTGIVTPAFARRNAFTRCSASDARCASTP